MPSQNTSNGTKHSRELATLIARIPSYDRAELIAEWKRLFSTDPAKKLSSAILIRIIIHELQAKNSGSLSNTAKRALRKKLTENYKASNTSTSLGFDSNSDSYRSKPNRSKSSGSHPPVLALGTQLVREWNGKPYRVEITENGFDLDGKTYRSLTAIAKKITGVHWSGPRFFGLTTSKPKKAPAGIARVAQ